MEGGEDSVMDISVGTPTSTSTIGYVRSPKSGTGVCVAVREWSGDNCREMRNEERQSVR